MNVRRKKPIRVPPFMRRITPYNDMYSSYTTRFIQNNPYQQSARRKIGGTPIRNHPSTDRRIINPAEPTLELASHHARFMCAERGTQTAAEEWQDEFSSIPDASNCVNRYLCIQKKIKHIFYIVWISSCFLKIQSSLERLNAIVNDCNKSAQKQKLEEYELLKNETSILLTKLNLLHDNFVEFDSKYMKNNAIVSDIQ